MAMQNILIVAATEAEVSFLKKFYPGIAFLNESSFRIYQTTFHILITGVGSVATAFSITKFIGRKKFALVINLGVAGAFNRKLNLGEVVRVTSECFGDLGAEDDENFLSLFDLDLAEPDLPPFTNEKIEMHVSDIFNAVNHLKKVEGLTVNKVHGNEASIAKLKKYFDADIETMEGAACFYVCEMLEVPCLQLRAISNYVEKRNRSNWKLKEAIDNLDKVVHDLIVEIVESNKK